MTMIPTKAEHRLGSQRIGSNLNLRSVTRPAFAVPTRAWGSFTPSVPASQECLGLVWPPHAAQLPPHCAAPAARLACRAAPAASTLPAVSEPSPEEVAKIFPNGEFSVEMQVRDYELDQFSVVNNAVYSSYFQHGRHEGLACLGHDVDEYARRGSPLALSEINIRFRAPLRSRDVFRVTFRVTRITGARLMLHQRILKKRARGPAGAAMAQQQAGQHEEEEEEELIAEADAVVVFLDSNYRPARMPRDAVRLFQMVAALNPPTANATAQ